LKPGQGLCQSLCKTFVAADSQMRHLDTGCVWSLLRHMANPSHPLPPEDALAALSWQVELGADEAIGDEPVNRYEAKPEPRQSASAARPAEIATKPADPVAEATNDETAVLAAACGSLDELRAAMAAFEGCELKKGARNLVFADGVRGARVMIVGEAPGREEDLQGFPFVGPSGQLLDRMFAAIGLSRKSEDPTSGIYITNTLPWRPPQNRDPSSSELTMMLPFLHRHIELANPEVLVTMGNPSTKTILQTTRGITTLRGKWAEALGRPVLPMFHPAALLRDPLKKRDAWADLLTLKDRLK
jgi:uracil-DNA glycosylase